jgi:preprotein translocase subunit SecF
MSEQTPATQQIEPTRSAGRHGLRDIAGRLYRGEAGIDVVGKRKIWYSVAAGIILVLIIAVLVRPFNLGIEFKGGNAFSIPQSVGTLDEARTAVEDAVGAVGGEVSSAQSIGGTNPTYLIKTAELDEDAQVAAREAQEVKADLEERFGLPTGAISESAVSGAWGASITRQAIIGTAVFLVLVVLYLSAVFREWKMAVAALAGLAQNLLLTAAIYLLIGFEITPSTVIGFLTILGFALYDTVVVFDKVRENTRGITGNPNRTYGEAANLAVNQTLMRSINTSIVALLPVGGLLFIGAGLLGAGTLKDLGLVLFVGMLAAVYSSIFLATPVLVDLKEAEPKFKLHRQRVLARRAAGGVAPERKRISVSGGPAEGTKAAKATSAKTAKATPAKAAPAQPVGSTTDEDALAGSAPRPGARPQARKRPGTNKPGSKGGSRSGGRKR